METVCIVEATMQQLESVGCSKDLTKHEVFYIKDYPTGYCQVKIELKDVSELLGKPIFEYYDIPKLWIKFKQ